MKSKYVVVLLSFCLTACVLDNYKSPDAQFYGSVIDVDTNEPIQQDMIQGSRIDYVEQKFENPNTQQMGFLTDGSFNNNLFSGTYEVQALRGNFFPTEKEMIDIKGKTEHFFLSYPYIRIQDVEVSFDEIRGEVTAEFTLEQVAQGRVESVHLMADRNLNLSYYLRSVITNQEVDAFVLPDQKFQLKMSTENLLSGKDYYFRVGALISGISEATHNYSQPVRLHIDNSNVIPDIPIPGKVLDACESLDGWNVNAATLSLDGDDKKEGNYSIRIAGNGEPLILFDKVFAPFDTEVTRENGYLAFDLYVSDISKLSLYGAANRLDLSSSGGPDVDAFAWYANEMDLVTGWNKVELSLAKAPVGNVRLDEINYFRFFDLYPTGPMVIKIDHIRFYSK